MPGTPLFLPDLAEGRGPVVAHAQAEARIDE
jgi:hypothetical protein